MAKVFVGLPVFNLIDPKVKENQDNFLRNTNHQITFSQVVGASVEHARQILIDRFLKTDCEYYFTMDADIVYLSDYSDPLERLISLDKDIIGGIYFYKRPPCLPVYRPLDLQEIYEKEGKFPENYKFIIPEIPFEVRWIGNGFKLVKREVIEKIREKILIPNLPMIHMNEYVSEDWAFDQRARELGFKVWADPEIKLGHQGQYIYTMEDFKRYDTD